MKVTEEEVRGFIEDSSREREGWLEAADRSTAELKRKYKNNNERTTWLKRNQQYPAWWSINNIRKPLIMSRIGIPVVKDATQDGADNVGATAALCLERLAVGLASETDFFEEMLACRDDNLATDFAVGRVYYEREEKKQRVKEYIQPELTPDGQSARFIDANGNDILDDEIEQDDEGYFVYRNRLVDIEYECVHFRHVLYKHFYPDPGVSKFNRQRRGAIEHFYSRPEFEELFGMSAYADLVHSYEQLYGNGQEFPKRQSIRVFEYWDDYAKVVLWLPEWGTKFVKPKDFEEPEEEWEGKARNGIYDLRQFFPWVKPFVVNQSTDEYYPTTEYEQLSGLLQDIHNIFGRMFAITKAIRAILFFDNDVDGVQEALAEGSDTDAYGVPNLSGILKDHGGDMRNVAQYLNIDTLIQSLSTMNDALQQRLTIVYQLSGTSDILHGQTDQTARTYGEQQLKERYALNQIAERQRKMQEFVRDGYRLLTETAIKNFKLSSLDIYIMPQTLPEEHQPRYRAAIGMLKENFKRFRLTLETDSTIAMNEEYDKQIRLELTKAISDTIKEVTAAMETSPRMAKILLQSMKYMIQGFRQGKIFNPELTIALDEAIQAADEAAKAAESQPPAFNKDEVNARLKQMDIEQKGQLGMFKLQQDGRIAQIESEITSFKAKNSAAVDASKLQLQFQQMMAEISLAQANLETTRRNAEANIAKIQGENERESMRLILDSSIAASEEALARQKQELEKAYGGLDLSERVATEQRLQEEHSIKNTETKLKIASMTKDLMTPPPTSSRQEIHVKRGDSGEISEIRAVEEK